MSESKYLDKTGLQHFLSKLDDRFLSKSGKASDSDKLDGQDSSYYLDYNNLTNKPAINNGTLTISGNGTSATTFTANQSGNSSLNIKGAGTTTVSRTASGEITITSADQYTGTVTGSGFTPNAIILGNAGTAIKASGYYLANVSTTWDSSGDTKIPTEALIDLQLPKVKRYI